MLSSAESPESLRHAFFEDLQTQLVEVATDHAMVHAGVVAFANRAVVIPGASHSGKTTLVAALVEAGGTYYSDEHAVVGADGRIDPFPRPLLFRDPLYFADPYDGFKVGIDAVKAHMVVLTSFESGASWRPQRIRPADALMAVLAHSLTIRSRPAVTLRALRTLVSSATSYSGARGDARETASMIVDRLAG
ncbi:MAG: hypothetical protein QOI95_321 [Acidimicrobiaceae bacterium]